MKRDAEYYFIEKYEYPKGERVSKRKVKGYSAALNDFKGEQRWLEGHNGFCGDGELGIIETSDDMRFSIYWPDDIGEGALLYVFVLLPAKPEAERISVNAVLFANVRDTLLSWAEHEQRVGEGADITITFEESVVDTQTRALRRAENFRLLAHMCDVARKEEG